MRCGCDALICKQSKKEMRTTTFHIPDMSCGHCKETVEKTIHVLNTDARMDFNLKALLIALYSRADTMNVHATLATVSYVPVIIGAPESEKSKRPIGRGNPSRSRVRTGWRQSSK